MELAVMESPVNESCRHTDCEFFGQCDRPSCCLSDPEVQSWIKESSQPNYAFGWIFLFMLLQAYPAYKLVAWLIWE